jgi:hypothetical protein
MNKLLLLLLSYYLFRNDVITTVAAFSSSSSTAFKIRSVSPFGSTPQKTLSHPNLSSHHNNNNSNMLLLARLPTENDDIVHHDHHHRQDTTPMTARQRLSLSSSSLLSLAKLAAATWLVLAATMGQPWMLAAHAADSRVVGEIQGSGIIFKVCTVFLR